MSLPVYDELHLATPASLRMDSEELIRVLKIGIEETRRSILYSTHLIEESYRILKTTQRTR